MPFVIPGAACAKRMLGSLLRRIHAGPSMKAAAVQNCRTRSSRSGGNIFTQFPLNPLFPLTPHIFSRPIYPHPKRYPHNPSIAPAGPGLEPGSRGSGGDLPPWCGSQGPEGPTQVGVERARRKCHCPKPCGEPAASCPWNVHGAGVVTGRLRDRHRDGRSKDRRKIQKMSEISAARLSRSLTMARR